MTTLLHPSSAESNTFQLDLFSVPPSQTSLEDGSFTEYHPVSVLTSTGPIELNQLEKPVFPSATLSIPIRAVNLENIGLLFILKSADEKNISIATD